MDVLRTCLGGVPRMIVWLVAFVKRRETAKAYDRTRFVHGAGWAAYIAFAELLNANCRDPKAFAEYVVQHSRQAFEDIHDETMVNRFWLEVIAGINTAAISRGFFFEREVTLNKDGGYSPVTMTVYETINASWLRGKCNFQNRHVRVR